jgi:hypothetical protein
MRTPDEYNAIALWKISRPYETKAFPHEFDAIQTRRPRGLARCSAWFPSLRGIRAHGPGTVVVAYTAFGV